VAVLTIGVAKVFISERRVIHGIRPALTKGATAMNRILKAEATQWA
jgi:hypothetical protein